VTDSSLAQLECCSLRSLGLNHTDITDTGKRISAAFLKMNYYTYLSIVAHAPEENPNF
jgi:hypothetical protein